MLSSIGRNSKCQDSQGQARYGAPADLEAVGALSHDCILHHVETLVDVGWHRLSPPARKISSTSHKSSTSIEHLATFFLNDLSPDRFTVMDTACKKKAGYETASTVCLARSLRKQYLSCSRHETCRVSCLESGTYTTRRRTTLTGDCSSKLFFNAAFPATLKLWSLICTNRQPVS